MFFVGFSIIVCYTDMAHIQCLWCSDALFILRKCSVQQFQGWCRLVEFLREMPVRQYVTIYVSICNYALCCSFCFTPIRYGTYIAWSTYCVIMLMKFSPHQNHQYFYFCCERQRKKPYQINDGDRACKRLQMDDIVEYKNCTTKRGGQSHS